MSACKVRGHCCDTCWRNSSLSDRDPDASRTRSCRKENLFRWKEKLFWWVVKADSERSYSNFCLLIPRPLNPGFGRSSLCISPRLRVQTASWKMLPQPCKVSPSWHHTVCKRPFHWFSPQLLEGPVDIIRGADSPGMNPLPCFICCKISSLLRSNAVCSIMTVKSVGCESTRGGYAVSIVIREGIFISAANVYSSEIKTLPLLCWRWSDSVNLPPGNWLTSPLPPGNCYLGELNLILAVGRLALVSVSHVARKMGG